MIIKEVTSKIAYCNPSDAIVKCNCGSNAIAIYFGEAKNYAGVFTIRKVDSGANAVTIYPNTGETIDGEASVTLTTINEYKTLVPHQTGFTVIDAYTATPSLTSPILTTPKIADGDAGLTITSANQTHASAVATVPDIGDAADEFVMKDTAQTLTSKTLTSPTINTPVLRLPTTAPVNAVASALTTSLAGANNDMVFTAKTKGVAGDSITVAYVDPGTPSASISVDVTGTAITISLATDATEPTPVITSTAANVKTAIEATPAAHALVGLANSGGDNGSGVVTALVATPLAGGVNGTVGAAGEIRADASYIFICTATNTVADGNWEQVAIASY